MVLRKVESEVDAEIDFQAVERRFIALNEARLERTREALQPRQREFLDLLPLLFHLNHPMLPGYVSKSAPAGVVGYQPDRKTLEAARRLAKGIEQRRQPLRRFPILGLYFMGSAGTIAYSQESDFDLWVCHDPGLSGDDVDQLRQRADAIEAWAEEFDLEVHFFLIDPERFRAGEIGGLSEESSGSAQHTLLLEEFYRTGLCLAGQYPIWWLVPPEKEAEYEDYVAELKHKRFLHARDHLDLGGLAHVPAEEFFGAALWQLYKGIDSPYKSILKLALMEAYASEYPHIELLSLRYKRAVYAGEANPDRLDPYLLMLEKAEEYLRGQEDNQRLDLVRRCFYFKAGRQLSEEPAAAQENWQHRRFQELVEGWGWSRADLVIMDSRESWKVHRVSEERRILFEALSASYRTLSSFARRYAGLALISQEDLTILGRKLYAAFERKAGKVELLNRGITRDLTEPQVTVHQASDGEGRDAWLLFRGLVRPEERQGRADPPLRRFRSAVELLCWCYFNRIVDRGTKVAFYSQQGSLNSKELNRLIELIRSTFPYDDLATRSMHDFARPGRVVRAGFFINVGVDPFARITRAGDQIATTRSDPLRFGARTENMIAQVDLVLVTSWQEILTFHYRGGKGLVACLCELLKWAPPSQGRRPAEVAVHAMSTLRGDSVTRRLQQLFEDVAETFYGPEADPATRYVIAAGDGYFVLSFDGDTPRYEAVDHYDALLRYLGRPQEAFRPVVLDRYALTDGLLPLIYQRNRPGYVQFFYRPVTDEEVEYYVLDERGSLFYQRAPFFDTSALINQFSRFFESVLNRINFLMQEGQSVAGAEGLEFYSVSRGARGSFQCERRPPQFGQPEQRYLSLQVIVDADENGQTVFTLYCGDEEFSTLEYGKGLFDAVVRYILELRQSGQHYPIYITDISMSRVVVGEEVAGRMQTLHFLNYKRRIEDKLNDAMARLS